LDLAPVVDVTIQGEFSMNLGPAGLNIPPWEFMWGLSVVIYSCLKWMTWHSSNVAAPVWKQLAYLFAWPGMDADAFLGTRRAVAAPSPSEWGFACFKLGGGLSLIGFAISRLHNERELVVGWIGMIGIVFTLHFGLFHVLSCCWRRCGIAATPLMNWPVLSSGVSEFWGRRWNLAFRDLTHKYLFQPLVRRIGPVAALLMGFFVSGVVHDLVISWPAGSGWGWPTGYFLLQGVGILVERSSPGRQMGLGKGWIGRAFCWLIVALPSPCLFHTAFVTGVIVPFLQAIGFSS
jgi:hypothetical protein